MIPWRSAWQVTPVFLPEKSHGQRRLVGCSPWDHKESDTTEWLKQYQQSIRSPIKIDLRRNSPAKLRTEFFLLTLFSTAKALGYDLSRRQETGNHSFIILVERKCSFPSIFGWSPRTQSYWDTQVTITPTKSSPEFCLFWLRAMKKTELPRWLRW